MAISTTLSRISDMILFFVALFIAVTNSLLIYLIIRSRTLRTVTNTFIVSMAVSDLVLTPALVVYISIRFSEDDDYTRGAYTLSIIILGLSPIMALVSFFFVSLDRYVAVCYPLLYKRKVTMKKAKAVICVLWLMNAVFISMCHNHYISQQPIGKLRDRVSPRTFVPRELYFWSYALSASLFLLLTIVLNIKLYVVFKNKTRKISVMCGPTTRLVKSGESMRTLKMLMTLFLMNIVTFVPSFVLGYFQSTDIVLVMNTVAFWAQTSNSFITPIIHICMNKSYRYAFYVLFGCVKYGKNFKNSLEIYEIPRRRRDAIVTENISVIGR